MNHQSSGTGVLRVIVPVKPLNGLEVELATKEIITWHRDLGGTVAAIYRVTPPGKPRVIVNSNLLGNSYAITRAVSLLLLQISELEKTAPAQFLFPTTLTVTIKECAPVRKPRKFLTVDMFEKFEHIRVLGQPA